MIEVPMTKGVTLVDDEDAPRVLHLKWKPLRCKNGSVYAVARTREQDGKEKTVYMHRLILDAPIGKDVDHRNGNGLDNRRQNLRLATRAQNSRNSRLQRDTASGYKGVRRHRRKWQAHIKVNRKRIYLGSFSSKEDAARTYDAAAKKHFGEFANLNFPSE